MHDTELSTTCFEKYDHEFGCFLQLHFCNTLQFCNVLRNSDLLNFLDILNAFLCIHFVGENFSSLGSNQVTLYQLATSGLFWITRLEELLWWIRPAQRQQETYEYKNYMYSRYILQYYHEEANRELDLMAAQDAARNKQTNHIFY